MNILEVSGLSKQYKNKKVISDVSFQVEQGELCALLGANGSGKTTIAHMITDLVHKDSGQVKIAGYDLDREYIQAMKHVGMCFDKFLLYEELSGYDNLKINAELCGIDVKDMEDILLQFGLWDILREKVKNYSSGMKQKLSIVRAIMKKPNLLIMDEPFNMLDYKSSSELYQMLNVLKERGMAILVVTHLIHDIEPYADSVIFVKNGSICLSGKLSEIKASKNQKIEEIYKELG